MVKADGKLNPSLPVWPRAILVHVPETASLGKALGLVVPGSCFSGSSRVPAGLVVTEGLAVTGGLGRVSFFRFFMMTFFFLMTRIRTCCSEVPGDQKGRAAGKERMAGNLKWRGLPPQENLQVHREAPPHVSRDLSMDFKALSLTPTYCYSHFLDSFSPLM